MSSAISEFPQHRNWRVLYKAAIVEIDLTKVPDRIAEAKKEIVQRARELFRITGNNMEEEQALDAAMCVLHTLHSTLKPRPLLVPTPRKDLKTA
jgi:hypothetical protein